MYGSYYQTPPASGGGGGGNNFEAEVPSGAVNGSNTAFILSQNPIDKSLVLTLNGMVQRPGVDFTLVDDLITFATAPLTGEDVFAHYVY